MKNRRRERKPYVPRDNNIIHDSHDVILLRDRDMLTQRTGVQGQYEKALKELLLENGSLVEMCWYEPAKLDLGRGDVYPPDFALPYLVGGKQVILELHNADHDYFERMGRLREKHGDRLYYILVKSYLHNPEEAYVSIGAKGENGKYVDECWHLPRIYMLGKKNIEQKSYEQWKSMMKAELEQFIAERADRIDNWEAAAALKNIRRER